MKILLSAYACEPNKGSEPGVGWSWAVELAKHYDVWVITRDNNQPTIEQYLNSNPEYKNKNLHFIYVGLSRKLTFWKKGRRGMRLFYMMWQKKAANVAAQWHNNIKFDLVQHITFVSYTQVTYMYKLGIPLIWGPVSGGENIPVGIDLNMTSRERLIEIVRRISQSFALTVPSVRNTMKAASLILAATDETAEKFPVKYRGKVQIIPAIGMEKMPETQRKECTDDRTKIIMAGRLIYWKAFDIGIKAFLKIAEQYPTVELHILGEGDKKKELQRLSGKYLESRIFFEEPVPHNEIYDFYSGFDIFLNTTLRDSGCMTMMEAMSVGLPSIAVAVGGPKVLLDKFEGMQIRGGNYQALVDQTACILERMILDKELRHRVGVAQREYSEQNFLIAKKCSLLQDYYKSKDE